MNEDTEKNAENFEDDKRRDTRLDFNLMEARGEDSLGHIFGVAKNLSKSGLFLSTEHTREIGAEFNLTFTLPFDKTNVCTLCRVVWVEAFNPDALKGPGMGVSFLDLDESIRDKIIQWLKSAEE
ncbi:MAG: PilZ domain-containing protein [Deltaproteobacteria bacterium]|nr:PilZ domain-containing protein [Deltaproteobacteria bacterium]